MLQLRPTLIQLPSPYWAAFRRRVDQEHRARQLTRSARDVLIAIAGLNTVGDHTPTVAEIAAAASCSPTTVRRARQCAERLGLLLVEPRFEILDGRPQQRSNAYALRVPSGAVVAKPRRSRGNQIDRPRQGSRTKAEKQEMPRGPLHTAIAAPSLLVLRQQHMEAVMRQRYGLE